MQATIGLNGWVLGARAGYFWPEPHQPSSPATAWKQGRNAQGIAVQRVRCGRQAVGTNRYAFRVGARFCTHPSGGVDFGHVKRVLCRVVVSSCVAVVVSSPAVSHCRLVALPCRLAFARCRTWRVAWRFVFLRPCLRRVCEANSRSSFRRVPFARFVRSIFLPCGVSAGRVPFGRGSLLYSGRFGDLSWPEIFVRTA